LNLLGFFPLICLHPETPTPFYLHPRLQPLSPASPSSRPVTPSSPTFTPNSHLGNPLHQQPGCLDPAATRARVKVAVAAGDTTRTHHVGQCGHLTASHTQHSSYLASDRAITRPGHPASRHISQQDQETLRALSPLRQSGARVLTGRVCE